MRSKEDIQNAFKQIERAFLKQDLTDTEATLEGLSILAECILDVRTNTKAIIEKLPDLTHKTTTQELLTESEENSSRIRNVM
jgi:hypothetical protein